MGIFSDIIHAACKKQETALRAQIKTLQDSRAVLEGQLALKNLSINTLTNQLAALQKKYTQFEGKEVVAIPKRHEPGEGIAATRAQCEQALKARLLGKRVNWVLCSSTDMNYRLYPLALLQQALTELPRSYARWTNDPATGWHQDYDDCDDDAGDWRYWLQRHFPGCPVAIVFMPGHFFAVAICRDGKVLQINGSLDGADAFNVWF